MKRLKYSISNITVLLMLIWVSTQGQNLERSSVIPPSPEAAAIAKYGQIPVNYYNGLSNVSIPLHNISVRDLNFPINLNYHPSGIRVNEEATWVGLGWTLSANGVIARTVYGKDDFQDSWYFNSSIPDIPGPPIDYFVGGCDVPYLNLVNHNTETLDLSSYVDRSSPYEYQPDMYSYNVPGSSGTFILDRNREPILQNFEKVEIKTSNDAADAWTIRTADGSRYDFEEYETFSGDYNSVPHTMKSAWYLTKITSPRGTSIIFEYDSEITYTRPLGSVSISETTMTTCTINSGGFTKSVSERKEYKHKYLKRIIYDHGKLEFDYDGLRDDLDGGKKLNKILLYEKELDGTYSTQPKKEISLTYSYFDGNNGYDGITAAACPGGYYSKRLKLESVEIQGVGQSLIGRYDFNYYETGNYKLPCKTSFAQDHWGYYNGKLTNTTLVPEFKGVLLMPTFHYAELNGADRSANGDLAKAFTLKSIEYPTGGVVDFIYEGHEYDESKSNGSDESAIFTAPPIRDRTKQFVHPSNGEMTDILNLSDLYVDEFTGKQSTMQVQAVFRCNSNCNGFNLTSNQVYFELYNTFGTFLRTIDFYDIGCSSESSSVCVYEMDYTDIDPGIYVVKAYVDPSITDMADLRIIYRWSEKITTTSTPIVSAGGLRISEIKADPVQGLPISRKFNYRFKEDLDGNGTLELTSSGIRMSRPQYEHYELDWDEFVDQFSNQLLVDCYRLNRTGDSSVPLTGSAMGSSVGYSKVEVLYGRTPDGFYGNGGKTIIEYHNYPDEIKNYYFKRVGGIPNLPNSMNGLLKNQVEYAFKNGEYFKVQQSENQYSQTNQTRTYGILKVDPVYSGGQLTVTPCDVYLYIYPVQSREWIKLDQTTRSIYDQIDPSKIFTSITDYEYDIYSNGHYLLSKTTTTDSEGKVIESETLYPNDPGTVSPARMWSPGAPDYKHMHGYPVITKTSVDGIVTNKIVNTYDFEGDNLVLDKVDVYRSGNAGLSTQTNKYDNDGNLLETSINGGMKVAYLWGYDNTLPIAKIDNADNSQIYFNGFENDLNAINDNDNSRSGNRYISNSYNVIFTPPGGIPYLITYWKYSNTSGKWEFIDEQTYSFNFQITADRIDDIRVYPQYALMTTYTYNPLRGITSMTDPNNVTTFYVYDDSGRLKHVLDHYKNKVKSFDYHNLNQN